jgi:hypothetical protein
MANNKIREVIINHIGYTAYITLPTLVISVNSTNAPSHNGALTKFKSAELYVVCIVGSHKDFSPLSTKPSCLLSLNIDIDRLKLEGNNLYKVKVNILPIIIAKGILLLLSVTNSDILTFISIRINKNNIDTAPTYTSK